MQHEQHKNIELSVAYVKFGGNSGANSEYFYSFSPDTIYCKEHNSVITYTLTADARKRFEMVEFLSSDGLGEFVDIKISGHGDVLQVTNTNKEKQTIKVSVIVKDTELNTYLNCDPQVLNSPDPQ